MQRGRADAVGSSAPVSNLTRIIRHNPFCLAFLRVTAFSPTAFRLPVSLEDGKLTPRSKRTSMFKSVSCQLCAWLGGGKRHQWRAIGAGQCPGLAELALQGWLKSETEGSRPGDRGMIPAVLESTLLESSVSGIAYHERSMAREALGRNKKKAQHRNANFPDQICELYPRLGWPQIDLRVRDGEMER